MNTKKIVTFSIFVMLLAVSVLLALWFWRKYISNSAITPIPSNPCTAEQLTSGYTVFNGACAEPTNNTIPCTEAQLGEGWSVINGVCTAPSTDPVGCTSSNPSIGTHAYAGTNGVVVTDMAGQNPRTFNTGEDIGKITCTLNENTNNAKFVIENIYLVSILDVTTH